MCGTPPHPYSSAPADGGVRYAGDGDAVPLCGPGGAVRLPGASGTCRDSRERGKAGGGGAPHVTLATPPEPF